LREGKGTDGCGEIVSPVGARSLSGRFRRKQLADKLGFTRYWLAEHHNTPLIASSAPEIMIGHVAAVTQRIRVGSGGMMLPNHTPLKVAESFRVLEALHPGRVDLGIGRAPGTDPLTAVALRGSRNALNADDFPARLSDLLSFLDHGFPHGHPLERIRAMPDDVPMPDIWLLGSSDFSAELSAQTGLRFAFAHHIQPWPAVGALRLYRDHFQPSEYLAQPEALIGVSAICAETDARAAELAKSLALTLLRFRSGKMGRFPSIEEASSYQFSPDELQIVEINRDRSFIGTPANVRERLTRLADQAGVDEIMITTMTHEHADRRRSYELLAEAFNLP
jgi:luciferase family oxidoreductase group 1